MSDHYYSSKPTSQSDIREVQVNLLHQSLRYYTDAGVFSKKGIDFGSRLLIETVSVSDQYETILDLGAGYGAIGIALAKAYPHVEVTMLDINQRAVELSEQNAKVNGVDGRTSSIQSDGFQKVEQRQFDLILCNPPIRAGKSIIYQWFRDARNHLQKNGSIWIVVRKQQGASSVKNELKRLYHQVTLITRKKGYWILQATNN